jgi:hypothetical protein
MVQGGGVVGGVIARSHKCGGGHLGFGLVREYIYIDRELCLLINMSRMGSITIRLDGKCSCN